MNFVVIVSKETGSTYKALPFNCGGITYFINSFDYPNFFCINFAMGEKFEMQTDLERQ